MSFLPPFFVGGASLAASFSPLMPVALIVCAGGDSGVGRLTVEERMFFFEKKSQETFVH
jgi:hypothetical protein